MESEVASLKSTIARLGTELELEKVKSEQKEQQFQSLQIKFQSLENLHQKLEEELKIKLLQLGKLEEQLQNFRTREENWLQEKAFLLEKEKEKNERQKFIPTPINTNHNNIPTSPSKFLSLPSGFVSDHIQLALQQKEGEVRALQEQIALLETSKANLQDELVKLTNSNELLKKEVSKLQQTQVQLADLTKRYETALVLIGEKEEQVEELKADIQDLKQTYKSQINALADQLEKLKKK